MTERMELRPADKENLAGQDTGRAHISHSMLNTFLACGKRFDFHYQQRLQKIEQPSYLGMGKAFHYAIEVGDPAEGAKLLSDRPLPDQESADQLRIDQAIVIGAATAYLNAYGQQDAGVQREVEYRVRLRSPWTGRPSMTFDLLGIADGVLDHGDHLELCEDKFVGRVDATAVKRVRLDRQVGLEAYALWRITGKPVRKIRYRFTKKPSIKLKQKETVDAFVERILADYAERPEFYLVEERTFRSDDDLLTLEAELWTWAEQIRHSKAQDLFPRNTSHCSDYGGCPFLDLCLHGQDAAGLYEVRPQREVVPA